VHELSIAEALFGLCRERVPAGERLTIVRIAVGELASIEPDQLQFAWEAVTAGGDHAGARLEVDWRPARQTCATCGEVAERQPGTWLRVCPHCELPLQIDGGHELDLLELEVEPLSSPFHRPTPKDPS
jgi:hydrogenase nickel insertion protein HypA